MARHWHQVEVNLQGQLWPSDAIDLSYRDAAKERREQLRAAAKSEHQAYATAQAETLTAAFPAPDPYETEAGSIEGRLVCIDRVSPRNMRNDGVQAWYILGDRSQGWYFLDVYSPEVVRMWDAILAYQRQVTPFLGESYTFYLRLSEEPMMRGQDGDEVAMGFKTRLVAAFIGGELFIQDLESEQPKVAGNDILQGTAMPPLAEDASPEEVAERRIAAVKLLRQDVWEDLFADWTVSEDMASKPIFLPYGLGDNEKRSGWEDSQKRLFSDVLDVKVLSSSEVYTVLPGDPTDDTPHVEACEVIIEHVGEVDGEYRSFKDSWLTHQWRLQRKDGGPWRLVHPRAL
jgi:hypothetical protein